MGVLISMGVFNINSYTVYILVELGGDCKPKTFFITYKKFVIEPQFIQEFTIRIHIRIHILHAM